MSTHTRRSSPFSFLAWGAPQATLRPGDDFDRGIAHAGNAPQLPGRHRKHGFGRSAVAHELPRELRADAGQQGEGEFVEKGFVVHR
jgi:hypothetical protein